jgi:hypothetical protein
MVTHDYIKEDVQRNAEQKTFALTAKKFKSTRNGLWDDDSIRIKLESRH